MRPTFLILALALVGCAPGVKWAGKTNNITLEPCRGWTNSEFREEAGTNDMERCFEGRLIGVNARNDAGSTSQYYAARNSSAETVEALVRAKANSEARLEDGETPLLMAARFGSAEIVETLPHAGANAKARTEDGKLPFGLAKGSKNLKNTSAYWKLNEARYE